jgi:hypothetical protein
MGIVILDDLHSLVALDCKNSLLKKIKNGLATNFKRNDCILVTFLKSSLFIKRRRLHGDVGRVKPVLKWSRSLPIDEMQRRDRSLNVVACDKIGAGPISGGVLAVSDDMGVQDHTIRKGTTSPTV